MPNDSVRYGLGENDRWKPEIVVIDVFVIFSISFSIGLMILAMLLLISKHPKTAEQTIAQVILFFSGFFFTGWSLVIPEVSSGWRIICLFLTDLVPCSIIVFLFDLNSRFNKVYGTFLQLSLDIVKFLAIKKNIKFLKISNIFLVILPILSLLISNFLSFTMDKLWPRGILYVVWSIAYCFHASTMVFYTESLSKSIIKTQQAMSRTSGSRLAQSMYLLRTEKNVKLHRNIIVPGLIFGAIMYGYMSIGTFMHSSKSFTSSLKIYDLIQMIFCCLMLIIIIPFAWTPIRCSRKKNFKRSILTSLLPPDSTLN